MAPETFDGFDHTQYRDEVEQRWGAQSYADGDRWWRSKSPDGRTAWQERADALAGDWRGVAERGVDPAGTEAQQLARRHAEWVGAVPGTPQSAPGVPSDEYLLALGEMYLVDERFAANYGGERGARIVRDALAAYVAARAS